MPKFIMNICLLGFLFTLHGITFTGQAVASEEAKEGEKADENIHITIPPIITAMYHKGRPKGNITIVMLLKVEDSEKRATALKYLPRLNNAYIMEASRLAHGYFDISRPVNIGILGDSFQRVTNRILGHTEAHLLISDVSINKK